MANTPEVPHPGTRIKDEVIPQGMSVTQAARLIGVGRPALSNLINGNAALSADMAARLEKAFNYPLKDLMDMQARFDAALAELRAPPADTKAYVPPFLAIKANDIETWCSTNISARHRLSILLRTLVHSTGSRLTKVDFPGNDDAERRGWDGFVESGEGTPWIPRGSSGWEFGTNQDVKSKAESDFEKSVRAVTKTTRAQMTFVFVTPRRWMGKAAWTVAKQATGQWKDVRVYDASDLEQWLEQSLPAQAWFANEARLPALDVRSLDRCWGDWADVSAPSLTGALFSSAIDNAKRVMLSLLSKPPERPILVVGDSTEEALAFLSQLLGDRGGAELAAYRDRVLVFDRPGVLPRLAATAQSFIAVAFTREVERELASLAKSMHCVVVYPRNAANAEADITLEPTTYETFSKGLEEMGKDSHEITRLANASGRSLTVLRRQLSSVLAVRTPKWAADRNAAASLIPFMFVGAWDSQNEADKVGLSLLAGGRSYDDLEKDTQRLAQLDDAPIWSIGTYRGVISKIDLLYAIAGALTPDDLKRYFAMARMVLGEDDPSLDIEEVERWMTPARREFSAAFRQGMSETLVLLALHGEYLFKSRLGINPELEATRVVRDLLPSPLTTRVLEANKRDLPTYAEAAPEEFLSIIERDLKADSPAVLALLRPAKADAFGSTPSRVGLLSALEGLSWNPTTLPRAALILARLAQVEIDDNWVNKPMHSLKSIFRAWMPQTAADTRQRVDLMKKLAERFPEVAWKVCVAQLGQHDDVGEYSHKPRWRSDGYGFGEPFSTWGPINEFRREMVEMALSQQNHSLPMLCDLVDCLHSLAKPDQSRVWALIEAWAKSEARDSDKAALREKIRVSTMSRRAELRARKRGRASFAAAGRSAFTALEPGNVIDKHAWLFRDRWVEESADEREEIEEFDYSEREVRIKKLRTEALCEILAQLGPVGILQLSARGGASWTIGELAASGVLSDDGLQEVLRLALSAIIAGEQDGHSHTNLVAGAMHAIIDDRKREAIIATVAKGLPGTDTVRLLLQAPYGPSTWRLIDGLGEVSRSDYWSEVTPSWIRDCDEANRESVERLLGAGRPRAAFSCIRFEPNKCDPQLLLRVMTEMAQGSNEQHSRYRVEQYDIERAFKCLSTSATITLDQKASLEFAYIEVLARPWDTRDTYGIPNLERYVEAHPELFVQAVVWAYKRNDTGTDPAEFEVPPARIDTMAKRGYRLLDGIERIPGHNDLGDLEADRLAKWIATVRQSCSELSRAEIADICIGKLLSRALVGKDGAWPCEPVRDVMEDLQSEPMMQGAYTGLYNSRGAHWRGDGGDQERALADKYRKWGQALQFSHPFVASSLLLRLAKTYDREASQEDTEAGIRRRLP